MYLKCFSKNRENFSKEINDTFTIFQNIRDHLKKPKVVCSNQKYSNVPSSNKKITITPQNSISKKRNLLLELDNDVSINKERKKLIDMKNSFDFKTLPKTMINSADKKNINLKSIQFSLGQKGLIFKAFISRRSL